MSKTAPFQSLSTVVDLREREKDRLVGELARVQNLSERHRKTLTRLEGLYQSAGASGAPKVAHLSALSLNCGEYKQAVMRMADAQREQLAVQEAEVQQARQALTQAVRKHEALGQVLARKEADLAREVSQQEQKRQDDLATQAWLRGQA
ncbi:MAG: flagellar export protein FliJ [Rhodocyclaceae bacterium]|uniref:Flagellar FliJ protein n=1 Tax=Sphingomonas sp. A1 TaxID=90322 RepID=A0A0A8JCU3_9SPHN|nr:flagellar FliJ protein [Sphingomonas sp. A1]